MTAKTSKLFILSILGTLFFAITSLHAIAQETKSAESGATNELVAVQDDGNSSYNTAVIQLLNKTNAKAEVVETKVGKKTAFGNIAVIAHKCWQAPLDQKPENKMLLEIFETKPNQPEKRIFYGWMFASSPSISGLEHPVYDITALNCKSSGK